MKFECIDCDVVFTAEFKENGYLPDCPKCGIDYRVYTLEEETE